MLMFTTTPSSRIHTTRKRAAWVLGFGFWALAACGGPPPPAEPSEPREEPMAAPPAAQEEKSTAPPKREAKKKKSAEEIEADKLAEAERRRAESAPEERNVLYRVTPEGLVVEVDGVRFKPRAEPVKKGNGGYGIRITVEAEALDDETHTLLSPENGPLSFAVTIFDKNGAEVARHGDTRSGDEPQFVTPGGTLTFTREWPSGSVKGPLWWGQRVALHAGLWGLGKGSDKTRPLKKFFVVEMVGGAKAQAVLTPPEIK